MGRSERVIAFADRLKVRLPVEAAVELAQFNESVIALENLVSNLYENDISLSDEEHTEAQALVADLGLAPIYAGALRGLPRPGDTRPRMRVLTVRGWNDSRSVHDALMRLLGFPDFYGRNWDAFWDSITGLVEMPESLVLYDWDVFAAKLPRDAFLLLDTLLRAKAELLTSAAEVRLIDSGDRELSAEVERDRLRMTD